MVSISNPLSITYGTREVGGSTDYQIHGPYTIEKSYGVLRLSFTVVVVSASFADLVDKSQALEVDFRKRLTDGDELTIDIESATDTYTVGSTLLRCVALIAKTGQPEVDVGFSRAYRVSIEAELPADAAEDGGLRDVEVHVAFSPSRQATVTMRGVYTATSAGDALDNYTSGFGTKAAAYLSLANSTAAWEMVDESYTLDRETASGTPTPHVLAFNRQYAELLVDQALNSRDAAEIRDHKVVFTDLASYPGDGAEQLVRLHRVVAIYDCAIDIDETTDLQATFANIIRPHVLALFEVNFQPSTFAVEEQRISYDETGKRVSAQFVIVYMGQGGDRLIEVSQSVTVRETRTIDYTPVHGPNELAAYADVGWATKERIWQRVAIALGEVPPAERITSKAAGTRNQSASRFSNPISGITAPDGRASVTGTGGIGDRLTAGWNVIMSTSQTTPQWIGVPGSDQIQITTVNETIVERYHETP